MFLVFQKMAYFSWWAQVTHTLSTKIRSSFAAVQSTTHWKEMVIITVLSASLFCFLSCFAFLLTFKNPILYDFFILLDTYTCNASGDWLSGSGKTEMPKCIEGTP